MMTIMIMIIMTMMVMMMMMMIIIIIMRDRGSTVWRNRLFTHLSRQDSTINSIILHMAAVVCRRFPYTVPH